MRDLGDLVSCVLVSLLLHLLSTLAVVHQVWKGAEISNLSQGWEENQKRTSAEGTPGSVQPSLDSAQQLPVLTDPTRTAPATQLLAQCNWKGLQRGKDCSVIGMNRRQKREPKIKRTDQFCLATAFCMESLFFFHPCCSAVSTAVFLIYLHKVL